jgi:small subunit ribosomal protein S8
MAMTDPIADFLTRIRNANTQLHKSVVIPASNVKVHLAEILREEGFIKDFEIIDQDKVQSNIKITLKYGTNRERVITGLKRISKPGLRVYCKGDNVPKVLGGLGIAIISTSKGIVTDKEARKLGLGGEVLCYIW